MNHGLRPGRFDVKPVKTRGPVLKLGLRTVVRRVVGRPPGLAVRLARIGPVGGNGQRAVAQEAVAFTRRSDHSPIHPDFARRIDVEGRLESLGFDPTFRRHLIGRMDRLHQLGPGVSDLGDRWSALGTSYGLAVLDPTADRRVIEFCFATPDSEFRSGGWDRLLVRKAMEGIVPKQIQWRSNRGEQAPDYLWRLRGPEPVIRSMVGRFEQCDPWRRYIDVPRVRRIAESPLEEATIRVLWAALTLGLFLTRLEGGPTGSPPPIGTPSPDVVPRNKE